MKLEQMKVLLRERKLDAVLAACPANIRYLSGFAGTESYLYVSEKRGVILTDSRYTLQAEEEGKGCEVRTIRRDLGYGKLLAQLLKEEQVENLGFEEDAMLYGTVRELQQEAGLPPERWRMLGDALSSFRKIKSPEELDRMVQTTATALDAEPAGEKPAQEAAPAEAKPEADEMVEKAPKGDDIGSKLDRILEMLEAKARGGRGEHPLHDETDLDDMIERLSGEQKEGSALTIPVENDCAAGPARDAAVELLKKVRPAVAAIADKQQRAKVTDALLSAVQGKDAMPDIVKAAMDSAQANAHKTSKTTYEQVCAESANAYAARNPHNKKEG